MSLVGLPRRSSHRPLGMMIAPGHPLARGLFQAWEFAAQGGGGAIQDQSRNGRSAVLESTGTANWYPTPLGVGYRPLAGSNNAVFNARNHNTSTYSVALAIMPTDTLTSANLADDSWGAIASATHSNAVNIHTDGRYELYLWDGGAKSIYSTTTAAGYRVDHLVATVTVGAMRLYVNGKLEASNLAIGTPYTHGFLGNYVAGRNITYGGANVVHLYHRVWTRVLTDGEVQALYAEPYGLYLSPRRYWLDAVAAAAVAQARYRALLGVGY